MLKQLVKWVSHFDYFIEGSCLVWIIFVQFRFVDADEMETIPGVKKAVPILAFRDGEKVKTGTWILTFDSLVCPEYINVCWLRVQVNAFIPKPLRCFKCQRFGHMGSKCKSKIDRCMQCAAPEKHTNCKLAKKCSNCLEAHSASDKNCQVYKETQLILRHQAENGGTFASSRRILFPSGTTYSRVANRQPPNHSKDAPGQSGRSSRASDRLSRSTGKSSQTTNQSSRTISRSSGAADKANETVLDLKVLWYSKEDSFQRYFGYITRYHTTEKGHVKCMTQETRVI